MQAVDNLAEYLSGDFRNRRTVFIFCKALVLFVLVKVIIIFPLVTGHIPYFFVSAPASWLGKVIFSMSLFANDYAAWVLGFLVVALAAILLLPWNYLSAIIFYIIVLNLLRIVKPMSNGTDIIIIGLAFWMIFAGGNPIAQRNLFMQRLQVLAFNGGVLLCQILVAFIYFHSGWDKLMSESWRTGDAMLYISNIRQMIRPELVSILNEGPFNPMLAWATILFELSFGVLVWFKRTRLIVLLIGVIFHVVIAIALSLPDFALLMAVSYLVFLKDGDFRRRTTV
jgi:hypothetical protein